MYKYVCVYSTNTRWFVRNPISQTNSFQAKGSFATCSFHCHSSATANRTWSFTCFSARQGKAVTEETSDDNENFFWGDICVYLCKICRFSDSQLFGTKVAANHVCPFPSVSVSRSSVAPGVTARSPAERRRPRSSCGADREGGSRTGRVAATPTGRFALVCYIIP